MDTDQRIEFLLNIYREFGSNAQEAFDFLKKNVGNFEPAVGSSDMMQDAWQKTETVDDGIYYVYNDGTFVSATNVAPTDNAKFVGICHDGHTFGVGRLIGEYSLLKKDNMPEDEYCIREEYKALFDWSFVEATNHIKELGTPIPFNEGEYLPTMPMFVIMANLADKGLNEALVRIGLDPIDLSEDYWFAGRCGANGAWIFYGSSGYLGNYYVNDRYRCQAVTLWNPIRAKPVLE